MNNIVRPLRVLLVSFALLGYQVGLTRYFSAVFLYHYAFLITSTAILAMGLGSFWALRKKAVGGDVERPEKLPWFLALATLMFFGLPFIPGFVPYLIGAGLPFFAAGIWFARLYAAHHRQTAYLYFADLAGAAIAAGLALTVIDALSVFAIFALATAAAAAAALPASRRVNSALVAGLLLVAVITTTFWGPEIDRNAPAVQGTPNSALLRSGGELLFSAWDSFARTDVFAVPNRENELMVSIDGGSLSGMWRYDGTPESVAWGEEYIGYLPLALGARERVLVMGPGGGRDVHLALLAGHRQVTGVEINRGSIEAVEQLADFAGGIYQRPEVEIVAGDGRSYVRSSQDKYDVIYLSQVMAQSADAAGYALAENYIYTKEAFHDYFDKLAPGGYLGFITHDEADLLKLITTAAEVLAERGVSESQLDRHLAIAFSPQPGHGDIPNPALLVKPEPLTAVEAEAFTDVAIEHGHTILHVPGMPGTVVTAIAQGEVTISELVADAPYDIRPATDLRPFFYKLERGIPAMLILLLFVSGLVATIFFSTRRTKTNASVKGWFALLGAAFMLVEVPLLQYYTLFMGHPSRSFTVVLAALLLSAGLGSALSGRLRSRRNLLYVLPLLLVLYPWLLPQAFSWFAGAGLALRVAVTFLSILPVGVFLGVLFPLSLAAMGEQGREESIPLAWALNGVMSVAGATLATVLAMHWGFAVTLYLGAALYLLLIRGLGQVILQE
ncbi:MAG: methyltransferase domain-containing protein [Firmicutes bacterium]|nr:methyltransferase domain-containing protein [Bacillota bacterium]